MQKQGRLVALRQIVREINESEIESRDARRVLIVCGTISLENTRRNGDGRGGENRIA